MEQAEPQVAEGYDTRRAPVLRRGLTFRPLSAGRVFVSHPQAASQVIDARAAASLQCCRGQSFAELLSEARQAMDYDCTADELTAFLTQMGNSGFFEGQPKRHPRVRLFNPEPAIEFLTRNCRWLFTRPLVVMLWVLLVAGLVRLLMNWDLFTAEVLRATQERPWLSVVLFYFCFVPIGLLHELAHGVVAGWFGGEVLEVGVNKSTANLYVLSNTGPLNSARARILYLAGGPFLDMFVFFALVNIWLAWPNYFTLMLLLPQALFVIQFSYAMEDGSDLSRIISEWTDTQESRGRWAFVKQFLAKRPQSPEGWRRAWFYLGSIGLQVVAFGFLAWSFREPVNIPVWPGVTLPIPCWPVALYWIYRWFRRGLMALVGKLQATAAKPAAVAAS